MRQPNDKKRPNTQGSKETAERKRNQKYFWVSKRLVEIPDEILTNIKHTVASVGRTFKRGA